MFGPPNPKTLIPPIIAPPLNAFDDAWRDNSRAPNNYINAPQKMFYAGLSGYGTGDLPKTAIIPDNADTLPVEAVKDVKEFYVQSLAGPKSWVYTKPASVNNTLGIISADQTGYTTRYGSKGGDYQLFVESPFPPPISTDVDRLARDTKIRDILMERAPGNVYDPRSYGYGPLNRIVIDEATGIPKYNYGDIDKARAQDYISRTNRNTYSDDRSLGTNAVRPQAQDQFIADSNWRRLNLQESLLRKRNSELWQQRVAPISPAYMN